MKSEVMLNAYRIDNNWQNLKAYIYIYIYIYINLLLIMKLVFNLSFFL